MKLITPLILTISLLSPIVGFAETNEKNCSEVEMNYVSYYAVSNIPKDQKVATFYKEKIQALEDFSKKYQLQRFKILSHDISVNSNSYIQDSIEVSLSISFEAAFDYSLLDKLRGDMSMSSLSSSRQLNSICE